MVVPIATLDRPPALGERYLVGVALGVLSRSHQNLHPLLSRPHWWPYRGKSHTDPDFEAYDLHYHLDVRVLDNEEMDGVWRAYERRELDDGRTPLPESAPYMIPLNVERILGYGVVERMVLRHDMVVENGKWTDAGVSDLLAGNPQRERWHLGERRICPHHGYDLRTIVPDADGCVTCPLHQLKYAADGRLLVSEHARRSAEIKRALRLLFDD